jgi:DNA invertase Pin-like site-specific DNA recombinase
MKDSIEQKRVIGYARVSREDQDLQIQKDALSKYGCELVFEEKKSGKDRSRPALKACLDELREGDELIVYKLDRLGRSLSDLIDIINELKERQVEFRSLGESIDTKSPMGKFFFHLMGALAQLERDRISERTKAGLDAVRRRGVHTGRPWKENHDILVEQCKKFRQQHIAGNEPLPLKDFCKGLGISKTTYYNYLNGETKAS